jgi:threonylcarbamoyladenosine tRNA methylthiotransferase MtaB
MGIKTVAIATLGCKVNQYDSATIAGMFYRRGYQIVDFSQPADVYVINTCTVTQTGDRKSRQLIRRAIKNNPVAFIVVTGCYAQVFPGEVMAIPGVDLVIGTQERGQIIDLIETAARQNGPLNIVQNVFQAKEFEELSSAPILSGRVRAFLKIQEGCSNYCSYCIVPYARGALKSRRPENILAEARRLIEEGFKEIVVTGIHVGAYGCDRQGNINLARLLTFLVELPGLVRLRLSSVEPLDVTSELIAVVATHEKICRHFHIPLQSGDDMVLKRMNRHYTVKYFRKLIQEIRRNIPEVAVTTDVMVGFPGETNEQFTNTFHFVEEMAFSRLHVFKYSSRQGTPAAKMPDQVPAAVKEERSKQMISLGNKLARSFALNFLDRQVEVLVEESLREFPGLCEGLTSNYLRVIFPASGELRTKLVKVNTSEIVGTALKGSLAEKNRIIKF